jgi:hypothetical protein
MLQKDAGRALTVLVTLGLFGSIRETVPSKRFPAQTAPSPTARGPSQRA